MRTTTHAILSWSTASLMIAATIGSFTPGALADSPQSESPNTTILYFVRHGEDVEELKTFDPSFTVVFNSCNSAGSCCVEALNPLGRMRAFALADWFEEQKIARTLTHVIASHKYRTRQTVQPIAMVAGLGGDLNGDGVLDGLDVDQVSGDGVINIPPLPGECDPGWTSSSSVIGPQTNYVNTLPLGSRAVLCSHSPALYPIMQAFGIDTSDPAKFPKDTRGRVTGFNNLWIVEMKPVMAGGTVRYQGRLLEHLFLDFTLSASLIDRDHGRQPSPAAMDDEE